MAEGSPDNITDATLKGPDPPYWKTVTLSYTCNEGYLTTEGEEWTNVTFNGTAWVLGDEDFACWKSTEYHLFCSSNVIVVTIFTWRSNVEMFICSSIVKSIFTIVIWKRMLNLFTLFFCRYYHYHCHLGE